MPGRQEVALLSGVSVGSEKREGSRESQTERVHPGPFADGLFFQFSQSSVEETPPT